jgi:hypothetical protein
LKIIGLRASALLAEVAREELDSDVEFIYVDPPASGARYLAELRKVQREYWNEAFFHRSRRSLIRSSNREEIMGQLYSRQWLEELESLELRSESPKTILSIEPSAGWDDLWKFDNIFLSPLLVRDLRETICAWEDA